MKSRELNVAGQLILQRQHFLFSFFTVKALPVYLRQGDGENGKPNLLEQTWKSKHAGAGKCRCTN